MPLPIPNLDDKSFQQIAEEGRSLIPSVSPEWTDHNVHDPGITFLELFAWLAEIEHYRLNRTSAASFRNFFLLSGLTPRDQQAAEVAIELGFEDQKSGVLIPANTKVTSVGNEGIPFQTIRDRYLTTARLKQVVTHAGGRAILQTKAQDNVAGYYEAFGPSPVEGDYLELGFEGEIKDGLFEGWFNEQQGHLAITLFEGDLTQRPPFAPGDRGFVSSARVRWEYLTDSRWSKLSIVEDGTLNLSRSGELTFLKPEQPPKLTRDNTGGKNRTFFWLRALLVGGRYEIPPRISAIRTNTIRARQVNTIVNEDLGRGLGTPDQMVRLQNMPLLLDAKVSDGPFQVGEVLDWRALVTSLTKPLGTYEPERAGAVEYVARRLREDAGAIIEAKDRFDDGKKDSLAQAFNKLLDLPDLYRREKFAWVRIPEELREMEADQARECSRGEHVRRFNRFLLQAIFPDQILSERLVIQTGIPAKLSEPEPESVDAGVTSGDFSQCESLATAKDGSKRWTTWDRVDDFSQSGPQDSHYMLDAETATVLFGNGLNGRVPQPTEFVRARFYLYTRGEKGNLSAGQRWQLALLQPDNKRIELRGENREPAAGGRKSETLDEAKARSREVFRKQHPVLTAKDYEVATRNTPGLRVARAKVVANFNPKLPGLRLPGEVTIVVVPQPAPKTAFANAPPPEPSDGFLSTVRNHLETLRLVATNVHVIGPNYVPVKVRCRVFLKKGASEEDTSKSIRKALDEFLDPVSGGPNRNEGWPFGRSVFPSEIHQQLAKLAGVDYVAGVALNENKPGDPLALSYNGLPTPGAHKVELVPFERRRQVTGDVEGGGCQGGGCRD